MYVAGNDGSVVEQVQYVPGMLREQDLFLGAFDGRSGMEIVCFLELLPGLFYVFNTELDEELRGWDRRYW